MSERKIKLYNVMYLGEIWWGNISHSFALKIVREHRARGQMSTIEAITGVELAVAGSIIKKN